MVGFFWGVTNPFLKRGTAGVTNINEDNKFLKILKEILFLGTNWKYMTPFLINQCGSILYYFSLKDSDLTLAVPICNSLAFVWTAVVGWCLGEEIPNRASQIGMMMIIFGISCYLMV
ncbi:transmembrane protein 234 isoform X2 [Halyomorpha halys]|nr:transmembrane protein 234 isoform X2 [Halyomorpha halys]XP_014286628.1 transmembrane protein 234 isoform X2 [Halyomorpha halys]